MPNIIGFYAETGPFGCFSNWYMRDFEIHGMTFCCMEQWMMWSKAKFFNDEEIASQIMSTNNPSTIKQLGRAVHNFDGRLWAGVRQLVVFRGAFRKFLQHEDLKKILLSTGDAILVEASPVDRIWGVRISEGSPELQNPDNWRGENLQGFMLMQVREELRNL